MTEVDAEGNSTARGTAPSLVLRLVQRLPADSATAALNAGGWDHLGWDMQTHLLAGVYDAVNVNTRATGNFKKAPNIPMWPRPKSKPVAGAETKQKVTVADLFKKFNSKR